jgi:malonate decarboxylase alpha subunit
MLDPSLRGSDHIFRLVRAATVCGSTGKLCPAERARQLLEAIIEPGDRVGDRGRQSAAGRFSRSALASVGVPMWNFSFPYKLKQLIDLSC